tara:strand:+ start:481 stop:1449 length:969 start_codon:yes stop_codon:yes gene_type:complete
MEFFNQKEEVIELKLTPYGRRLLSAGEFSPSFYAFYDDDIVYDTQYSSPGKGPAEVQKESEDRIKTTPRIKNVTIFEGVDSTFRRINKTFGDTKSDVIKKLKKLKNATSRENIYSLPTPLGSAEIGTQRAPAWDLNFLLSKPTGSSDILTGSHGLIKIPQLEVQAFYDTSIAELSPTQDDPLYNVPGTTVDGIEKVSVSKIFEDNTFVELKKEYILVDIQEINGINERTNYDIEVFQIKTKANGEEHLSRLKFLKDEIEVSHDDIIYDPNLQEDVQINENYVEYYFDFRVDDEIDTPVIGETRKQQISFPMSDLEPCADKPI